MLNAGKGAEFKGKALAEIEITGDVLDDISDQSDILNEIPEEQIDIPTESTEDNGPPPETKKFEVNYTHVNKGKSRWTQKDKRIVLSYFKQHLEERRAPKKKECLELISAHPDKFSIADWVRIKTLVFNTYRVK